MKITIKNIILLSLLVGLAGCSENSWNNSNLDGFQEGPTYSAVTGAYTLTSGNYANVATALKNGFAGTDMSAAADAAATSIQDNQYFSQLSDFPDAIALPYFLNTYNNPYYTAPVNSRVDLTYAVVQEDVIASYTVTEADYQEVWGSETGYIEAFAPEKPASDYVSTILSNVYPRAQEGDYVIITYNESTENPTFEDVYISQADNYDGESLVEGKYLLTDVKGSLIATNLSISNPTYTYGFLASTDVSINNGSFSISSPEKYLFEFKSTGVDNEFNIIDPNTGNYYVQTGTNNNFNVYATVSEANTDNATWIPTLRSDGTWEIMNKGRAKWIQTPTGTRYDTWGSYNYVSGGYPNLYVISGTSDETVSVPVTIPSSSVVTKFYSFNGTEWALLSDSQNEIYVLSEEDYTEMGCQNNSLSNPAYNLPIWLKSKYPYASLDQRVVLAYNYTSKGTYSTSVFYYDGSSWGLNDNYYQVVTGRFRRVSQTWTASDWVFVKYIGEETYAEFTADAIELERSYMFLVDKYAMRSLTTSGKTFDYPPSQTVEIEEGQIILSNDNSSFLFTQTYVNEEGEESTVSGEEFFIIDNEGRYMYAYGMSSNKINFDLSVSTNGPSPSRDYLWNITKNDDGTWSLTNARYPLTLAKYSNNTWGIYPQSQLEGSNTRTLPVIYQLVE